MVRIGGLVALVAVLQVASACIFFAGNGNEIDLSSIAVNNTGPLPTDDPQLLIVLNPCSKLVYDALIPADNLQCGPSDNACVLDNDPVDGLTPAYSGGNHFSSLTEGNTTEIIITGHWDEVCNRYMSIHITLTCSTAGLGSPVFQAHDSCDYYYSWASSAACTKPITPNPELPWERNNFPTPTNVIHRGEYSIRPPRLDLPLQGYVVTSDYDTIGSSLGPKECSKVISDQDYYACKFTNISSSVDIDLHDVVLFALVLNSSSPVYFGGSPGYFAITDIPSDHGRDLFTIAPANSPIGVGLALGDRSVNAYSFAAGTAGSGSFNFFTLNKYQIATAGSNPLTPGGKIGVLFGIIVGVILIIVVIYCIIRRRNKNKYAIVA